MKTQGEIEVAMCEGISRFEQDYVGRGPKDIQAHVLDDLVVVRLARVLPGAPKRAERQGRDRDGHVA